MSLGTFRLSTCEAGTFCVHENRPKIVYLGLFKFLFNTRLTVKIQHTHDHSGVTGKFK